MSPGRYLFLVSCLYDLVLLCTIMPLIPEIFRLDGRDDIPETQEDPVTEDEHLDELDGQDPWLEALERQAASNQIQEPLQSGDASAVTQASFCRPAKNQLLDDLGVILDMPQSTATFAKLEATVPVCGVNGRLTISVLDFCKRVATDSSRWKQLQDSVDWSDPPPQLVFMAQAVFIAQHLETLLCLMQLQCGFATGAAW